MTGVRLWVEPHQHDGSVVLPIVEAHLTRRPEVSFVIQVEIIFGLFCRVHS